MGKYLVTSRTRPTDFRPKGKAKLENNTKPEESFKDAMKRAFSSDISSLEYNMSSDGGSYLNANTYTKLLNSDMDPDALTRQIAKAGPEGIRFLMHCLAQQCQKYQSTLSSLYDISHEIELEGAASKLFKVMMEVTNARYGTLYNIQQNKTMI